MTRHRNEHRGFALILVMILVVVAGILGVSYVAGSTVQMVSSDNLLWATRAKYLGESGLDHAAWMLRTDPEAPWNLQGRWSGQFQADGTSDRYVFTATRVGNAVYTVTGIGTAHGISQTTSMTLQLVSGYMALIEQEQPVCLWRLGESYGPIAADSASGINGTYYSVSLGRLGPLAGDENTAAQFNGYNSYVEIPHSDSLLLDTGTVLLWFKAVGSVGYDGLFSKDSGGRGTGGHLMIQTNHQKVEVCLQGIMMEYNLASKEIMPDQWYFVAFTFGSGGMKLYVNGEMDDANSYTGGLGTTSGGAGNHEPIAIGASSADSNPGAVWPLKEYFAGLVDEVAVFDRALAAERIKQLYDARIAEARVTAWHK